MTAPIIIDDFLRFPEAVRELGLNAPYKDVPSPDGETYKRVCVTEVPGVRAGIEKAMGRPVDMHVMAFRLNYAGEMPNASIHSDIGYGTHALVLYLVKSNEGGTAFWKHRSTRAHRIDPGDKVLYEKVKDDFNDESKWSMRQLVPIRFNRAVIYESALFHSRYPFAAFGNDNEDGRLIAVAFFS